MKKWILAAAIFGVACGEAVDEPADGRDDAFTIDGKADNFGASQAEAEAVLVFVNSATLEALDDEVGLDARAASNIIKHRNGADGKANTRDDNAFDDLEELDAVPYVGPKAFASLLDFVRVTTPEEPACFLISEYVESAGTYTKGIEIYNCGSARSTSDIGVCLVRNGDKDCSVTRMLDGSEVSSLGVTTLCRSLGGNSEDPIPAFKERCDAEIGTAASFNGDDRLIVFQDQNGDGAFAAADDRVLDIFGAVGTQPEGLPWKDVVLRRQKPEPFTSLGARSFDALTYFTVHSAEDFSDFGVAPRFRFL